MLHPLQRQYHGILGQTCVESKRRKLFRKIVGWCLHDGQFTRCGKVGKVVEVVEVVKEVERGEKR